MCPKYDLKRLLLFTALMVTFVNKTTEAKDTSSIFNKLQIQSTGGICTPLNNPASLGVSSRVRKMVPYRNSLSAGYWSDKLALTPYKEYFAMGKEGNRKRLVERLINESFGVAGKSAAETSGTITEKVAGGMSVYGTTEMNVLGIAMDNISLNVRTNGVAQIDIPEAPFLILFSSQSGLKSGADLSLKNMGATMQVTTDIELTYGNNWSHGGFAEKINSVTGNVTDFKDAAWGIGLTFSLGNSYLDLRTADGSIRMNEDGTEVVMDADLNLKTTGTGLENNWKFRSPFNENPRIAGWGAGVNAGLLFYGDAVSAGISLRRLGPMIWRNVQEADITVRTRTLSVLELLTEELSESDYDLFDSTDGGMFPVPENGDTLKASENIVCWQPATVAIGLGYTFKFRSKRNAVANALSRYIMTTFEYEQNLVRYPGRSFLPNVDIGVENGTFWGIVPIRAGLLLGGARKVASSAGFSLNLPFVSLQANYTAIGTPFWYPKRGFAISMGLSSGWFTSRDSDELKADGK